VEALSNSAAVQLPVILIAAFAVGPEAGFVLLASRALGAPMQIVGAAISQVYLAQAPAEHRAGRLRTFTLNILGRLALFGIPSLVILALVAPNLFELLFGAEWRRAGTLLQWMTPWFIFQLLSAPVSTVFHVTGYQRTATILQISGLCLRAGMVLVACYWYNNYIAEAYALSGAIFYAIYGIAIFCILPRNNRKNAW
jgi:O-antigen/teichoic acid export membrane protein